MVNELEQRIINFLKENKIVCPLPNKWNELWKLMIRDVHPKDSKGLVAVQIREKFNLPLPCVLHGWYVSDEKKKERFKEHIAWAKKHEILPLLENYITKLEKNHFLYEK